MAHAVALRTPAKINRIDHNNEPKNKQKWTLFMVFFAFLYASMAHKPFLFRCPCTHVSANVTILNFEAFKMLYRLWTQLYTNYQIPEFQNVWWYILSNFEHFSYENMAHDLVFQVPFYTRIKKFHPSQFRGYCNVVPITNPVIYCQLNSQSWKCITVYSEEDLFFRKVYMVVSWK